MAIVKSGMANVTASPATITFTGGNTNGNSIVIGIVQGSSTSDHITSVTDGEGNTYANVASLSGHGVAQNEWHSWWVAPVTGGSTSNNTITIAYSAGPSRVLAHALEVSGIVTTSPFESSASTASNNGTSVSYSISEAAAGNLILSMNSRTSGGSNWSGLSGTDVFGVTNVTTEVNWSTGAAGSNTVTATCNNSGFGSTAISLKPAGTLPPGTKFKGFVTAAICNGSTAGTSLSLPSTNAPTPNCNTGTNVQEGTLDFADGQSAQFGYLLPSDWDGTMAARVVFFSPSTSGTVIFSLSTACSNTTSGTVTGDAAFNAAANFSTVTLGSTANAEHDAAITSANLGTCAAGNRITFRVKRETDTATGVARLQGIELQVPRNL